MLGRDVVFEKKMKQQLGQIPDRLYLTSDYRLYAPILTISL